MTTKDKFFLTSMLMVAILAVGVINTISLTRAEAGTVYPDGKLDGAYLVHNANSYAINESTQLTGHELVAAPGAGKRIYFKLFIQSEGSVDVTFLSASDNLTGTIEMADGDTWERGWYRCGVNEALNLTTSGAVQVNGDVIYVIQ